MRIFLVLVGLGVAIMGLAPGITAASGVANVTAKTPWMRYLLPSLPAGGYVTLNNSGDADAVVTGAASPDCGGIMLHESKDNSGMAMMLDVTTVTVPAHGSMSFTPGGYHLMCMAPKMHPGMRVPVTLMFRGGDTLALTMQVYGAMGAP